MKRIIVSLIVLCLAGSLFAADKAELDNRVRKLTGKFEAMQAKPDKRIPAENLRKAQGIVLLDRTKAGFVFPRSEERRVGKECRDRKSTRLNSSHSLTSRMPSSA